MVRMSSIDSVGGDGLMMEVVLLFLHCSMDGLVYAVYLNVDGWMGSGGWLVAVEWGRGWCICRSASSTKNNHDPSHPRSLGTKKPLN
jgi:hypothetical protein